MWKIPKIRNRDGSLEVSPYPSSRNRSKNGQVSLGSCILATAPRGPHPDQAVLLKSPSCVEEVRTQLLLGPTSYTYLRMEGSTSL